MLLCVSACIPSVTGPHTPGGALSRPHRCGVRALPGSWICPRPFIHSQNISWQLRCLQTHLQCCTARRGPESSVPTSGVPGVSPAPTQAWEPGQGCWAETAVVGALGRNRQSLVLALRAEAPRPAPWPAPYLRGAPYKMLTRTVAPFFLFPVQACLDPAWGWGRAWWSSPCYRRFQHREPRLGRGFTSGRASPFSSLHGLKTQEHLNFCLPFCLPALPIGLCL